MSLDWMSRDNTPKDHLLHTDAHWGMDDEATLYLMLVQFFNAPRQERDYLSVKCFSISQSSFQCCLGICPNTEGEFSC